MRVFVIGPYQTKAQLLRVQKVRKVLLNNDVEFSGSWENEDNLPLNRSHIEKADFVISIMNTFDVATTFLTGYAYAEGKPIVYFGEDHTSILAVMGLSAKFVCTNQSELDRVIYRSKLFGSIDQIPSEPFNGSVVPSFGTEG